LQRPDAPGFEPDFALSSEPIAATASAIEPVESDAFDRVSIDWVPSDDPSSPVASATAVAPLEARGEEGANALPSASSAENGGYIERYQRLFASDVVDPERAILAALDAAIQAPAEAPREDVPDAVTAPLVLPNTAPAAAEAIQSSAAYAPASVVTSEPEQPFAPAPFVAALDAGAAAPVLAESAPAVESPPAIQPSPAIVPSSAIVPSPAIEPARAIAIASDLAVEPPVAAVPVIAAAVASAVPAVASSEPPPATNPASSPPDATPSSQARAKLDVTRDVDWSEDVLARAARAAAAAGERARAHQQAQAASLGSQRPGPASSSQGRTSERPAADHARADGVARARSSGGFEAASNERTTRHKARRQQARRARFAATPLFLFAFVGSVMVALGVGFVTGFVVGRETPKAAQASIALPAAEPAAPVSEPAASAGEAQPTARRKGALTSRVEAVVPGPAPSGQPETAGAAANAPAKLVRGPFDPKSAGAALSKAASRAGVCVPPGDAGGEAVVTITLDPSGVTSNAAVYGARFAGTQAGECIAGLLRDVKVRPFTGEAVTVKKTIQVN
jgi:hypothetical protein